MDTGLVFAPTPTSLIRVAQTHSTSALPVLEMPQGKGKPGVAENPREVRPAVADTCVLPPTCFRPLRLKWEFLRSTRRQDPRRPFDLVAAVPRVSLLPLLTLGVLAIRMGTPAPTISQKWDPSTAFRVFVLRCAQMAHNPRFWTNELSTRRNPVRVPALRCPTPSREGKHSRESGNRFSTAAYTPPANHSCALIPNTNSHDRLIRFAGANTRG